MAIMLFALWIAFMFHLLNVSYTDLVKSYGDTNKILFFLSMDLFFFVLGCYFIDSLIFQLCLAIVTIILIARQAIDKKNTLKKDH